MKKITPFNAAYLYRIHMPYGLKQLKNGRWFIFNREYLPVGKLVDGESRFSIHDEDRIPSEFTFKMILSEADRTKLTIYPHPDESTIFLYNDASNPLNKNDALSSYLEKVQILMNLKVW